MKKRSVLVVADDPALARQLERQLDQAGYQAAWTVSLEAGGADAPGPAAPELLLLDVLPGEVAGRAAAAAEHLRDSTIPVLFLIAEGDQTGLAEAAYTGQHGYVVKPFGERELHANVELALCRRDALEAMQAMEDRFFDTSIDMLCFLGFDGYFRRLNPAWERTLGFTREELMSRPFIEFVHPDDRERTRNQNRGVRAGGQALSFENRYLCKDGSYRWLRWNAAPDLGARTIYSVARDVTETKQAEEERERLVQRLQAALAEVRTLRTILPICSYCRKIRDDENYWHTVEAYVSRHTDTRFTHGICPSCMAEKVEPWFDEPKGK